MIHCATCDEPDPHCEHGVNIAVAVCARCTPIQPATCWQYLEHVVTRHQHMVTSCDLHRYDLVRGVGVVDLMLRTGERLVEWIGPETPCSYCVVAHGEVTP